MDYLIKLTNAHLEIKSLETNTNTMFHLLFFLKPQTLVISTSLVPSPQVFVQQALTGVFPDHPI